MFSFWWISSINPRVFLDVNFVLQRKIKIGKRGTEEHLLLKQPVDINNNVIKLLLCLGYKFCHLGESISSAGWEGRDCWCIPQIINFCWKIIFSNFLSNKEITYPRIIAYSEYFMILGFLRSSPTRSTFFAVRCDYGCKVGRDKCLSLWTYGRANRYYRILSFFNKIPKICSHRTKWLRQSWTRRSATGISVLSYYGLLYQ